MGGAAPEQAGAMWAYGRHLGMAFQVVDDLLDVSAEAEVVGKPVGNDLRSGVLTLPILHLLRSQGYQGEAASLVAKGADMTPADIDRSLSWCAKTGPSTTLSRSRKALRIKRKRR